MSMKNIIVFHFSDHNNDLLVQIQWLNNRWCIRSLFISSNDRALSVLAVTIVKKVLKRRHYLTQLFWERLLEKVHATIPKGIVGQVLSSLLKEIWQNAPEAMDIKCLRVLKESNKRRFDSYSVRKSKLMVSHISCRDCRVHVYSHNLSRNSCIQEFNLQPLWINSP